MMSSLNLTKRSGNPPIVRKEPPQIQKNEHSPKAIYNALHAWLFDPKTFPNALKGPTVLADPTTEALFLKLDVPAAQGAVFMPPEGSREFAHLHEEGSSHIVVNTSVEDEILASNWGIRHMFYDRGVKETLVYAPRNEEEMEVVKKLYQESYKFHNGP